jgi:hypothetical protein
MGRITTLKAVGLGMLLLGGSPLLADHAQAAMRERPPPKGASGVSLNGINPNGLSLNTAKPQGRAVAGNAAGAADLGALRVRTVRLANGRTLVPALP